MPSLKDLTCYVECNHGGTRQRLREFATTYGDNAVEAFVAIPNEPMPFVIRLQNTAFIYAGLAVHVYIDGVFQCSRIKVGMEDDPKDAPKFQKRFALKGKETNLSDDRGARRSIDRPWVFEKLRLGTSSHFSYGSPLLSCSR
jgi:hypothetical protein